MRLNSKTLREGKRVISRRANKNGAQSVGPSELSDYLAVGKLIVAKRLRVYTDLMEKSGV
jgi:hypothetical protein